MSREEVAQSLGKILGVAVNASAVEGRERRAGPGKAAGNPGKPAGTEGWSPSQNTVPSKSVEISRGIGRMLVAPTAPPARSDPVSYTHLRAHETGLDLGCRLLL